MIWAAETNVGPGSVCLLLSLDFYCESDYIREYADYLSMVKSPDGTP